MTSSSTIFVTDKAEDKATRSIFCTSDASRCCVLIGRLTIEGNVLHAEMLTPFGTNPKELRRNDFEQLVQVALRDSAPVVCDNAMSRAGQPYLGCVWNRLSCRDMNVDRFAVLV